MLFWCPVFAVVLVVLLSRVFGWLNVFNAELPLKRYRRGPRSQEMEEDGDYT